MCNESPVVRQETAAAAGRGVSADDAGVPSCPHGGLPLCILSNIDLSEGGPRPSDQCAPLIVVAFGAGETSFTWSSPSGQRVDGVLVRSGTTTILHAYNPSVSADATPISSPTGAQLTRLTFCGTLGANADAGTASDAGAVDASPEPPPNDGGTADAGGDASSEPPPNDGGTSTF